MSAKHTPGPWKPACGARGSTCRHPAILHDGGQVGNATWQGSEAATDANARLIAAAPDLLEALKACDEAMSYMSEYDIPLTLPGQVKDAIAKAIG